MKALSYFRYVACATMLSMAGVAAAAEVARRVEGALVLEDVPAVLPADAAALRPYLEARVGTVFGWLPHGDGPLIGTRFGDTQQLHAVRAPMGARTQLTFAAEPILTAITNHNTLAPAMIYARDSGGDEQFQLYFHNLLTNESALLTEGAATRNEKPVYAPDGFVFAYTRTDASGQYQIRIGDTRLPGKTKTVFTAPDAARGTWYVMDISANSGKLLLQNYASVLDSNLVELNLKTGQRRAITAPRGVAARDARYSPDGQSVFYLSDAGHDYLQLWRFDFASKGQVQMSPYLSGDVEEFSLNADASEVALNVNVEGSSEVQVYRMHDLTAPNHLSVTIEPIARASAKPGVITGVQFHPTDDRVLMSLSSAQNPGNAFELDTKTGKVSAWTDHELGGMHAGSLIVPERIQFVGGTGTTRYNIQGFVYRPQHIGKHPVLVLIHGGPESQARPGFDAWIQFLVRELHIAVITPNVRGSTGYGRAFTTMDDGIKREDAITDLGALLDWIAKQSDFDAKKVALMGGSYGGFMTLAGLTRYSDRLACGVDVVGMSDLSTFLQNTSNYRRNLRRIEYGDEREPDVSKFFEHISPLKNARKIKVPLMVVQGANDPRVPASEATQIAAAVRANGQPVWSMMANDEGHGFKKKANLDRMRLAVAAFLRQHLLAP
jgi:protease II